MLTTVRIILTCMIKDKCASEWSGSISNQKEEAIGPRTNVRMCATPESCALPPAICSHPVAVLFWGWCRSVVHAECLTGWLWGCVWVLQKQVLRGDAQLSVARMLDRQRRKYFEPIGSYQLLFEADVLAMDLLGPFRSRWSASRYPERCSLSGTPGRPGCYPSCCCSWRISSS